MAFAGVGACAVELHHLLLCVGEKPVPFNEKLYCELQCALTFISLLFGGFLFESNCEKKVIQKTPTFVSEMNRPQLSTTVTATWY